MDNPFKAKEGQRTCNSCVHYDRCAELNKSVEHLSGCVTCKCFEDKNEMRRQVAKDILKMIKEASSVRNGMRYRFPEMIVENKIREKYGVEINDEKESEG